MVAVVAGSSVTAAGVVRDRTCPLVNALARLEAQAAARAVGGRALEIARRLTWTRHGDQTPALCTVGGNPGDWLDTRTLLAWSAARDEVFLVLIQNKAAGPPVNNAPSP